MEADLNELLYRMLVPQMTQKEKSKCYGHMLSVLMDDPSRVSYLTGNPMLLGKVALIDMWFLTMFHVCLHHVCTHLGGQSSATSMSWHVYLRQIDAHQSTYSSHRSPTPFLGFQQRRRHGRRAI